MRIEKVKQTSKQNKLIICSKTKLLIELSSRRKVWHRNISPVSTNETKQALAYGSMWRHLAMVLHNYVDPAIINIILLYCHTVHAHDVCINH